MVDYISPIFKAKFSTHIHYAKTQDVILHWHFNGSKAYIEILLIQSIHNYHPKASVTQSKQKHSISRF